MCTVFLLHAEVLFFGRLQYRVTELAGEEKQRVLAFGLHVFHERLYDERPRSECFLEISDYVGRNRPVEQERVMRVGADDRLDDDPVGLMCFEKTRECFRIEFLVPDTWHDRRTPRFVGLPGRNEGEP